MLARAMSDKGVARDHLAAVRRSLKRRLGLGAIAQQLRPDSSS
jgi:hypothetical protein